MFPQVAFQICRCASSIEHMFGLLQQESLIQNFYCERVGDTLVICPKLYGKVNGVHSLEETSVGIYAPIDVIDGEYKTSIWPLEALKQIQSFVSEVNPHTRRVYTLFNLKDNMPAFLESKQYKVLRLGACVTQGLLVTPAFKPPCGQHTINFTELAVNCKPSVGKELWESLLQILLSKKGKRSGDLRVKICIQKKLWWEMSVHLLFDIAEISQVTSIINSKSLPWKESVAGHQVACMHEDNKFLRAINKGLRNNYALTSLHSCEREMVDIPNNFTADMLQSIMFGFGSHLTMIGVPLPSLLPPTSDLVFAALYEEEDFWLFMNDTVSQRQMDKFDIFGIILSAVVSKF